MALLKIEISKHREKSPDNGHCNKEGKEVLKTKAPDIVNV